MIVEYEHFTPEFQFATSHNADGIILLCPTCHAKKGFLLSRDQIAKAASYPKCKQLGYSSEGSSFGTAIPEIVLGNNVCEFTEVVLRIADENVISILPPESRGGPFRINATIRDINGNVILSIVENEWRVPVSNWDVEQVGQKLKLRRRLGEFSLVLRSDPPKQLIFETLNISHRGWTISCDENGPLILSQSGQKRATLSRCRGLHLGAFVTVTEDGAMRIGSGGSGLGMDPNQPLFNSDPFNLVFTGEWPVTLRATLRSSSCMPRWSVFS
ncbi:MAG: hypothetical protein M3O03_01465 [Pseudomonadota bacterium]|nr:hypothetical protein [Pseudomonadota bacterium]